MGAHTDAMDRLADRARAGGAEVIDIEEGHYSDGDEIERVHSFTVVDPEDHRRRFDGTVALTG